MKIRHKITLWISGTALLAALGFSSFIYFELLEEPYRIIRKQLTHLTTLIVDEGRQSTTIPWQIQPRHILYDPDLYWLKVTDTQGTILYQSKPSLFVDLAEKHDKTEYTVERKIPRDLIFLGQDKDDEVAFRVKVSKATIKGETVTIRLGQPIEPLEQSVEELMREFATALISCTILTILASFWLAGRILQPLSHITHLATEISERSLHKRLPEGKNNDEIGKLIHTLNTMFDRLESSFDSQREFIGNASHELKSPIAIMRLNLEELLVNETLDPAIRRHLESQFTSLQRLSHLVSKLLDLSRLQQQGLNHLTICDITGLVSEINTEFQEMLTSHHLTIDSQLPPGLTIKGDRDQLLRLLTNILDNAIRYSTNTAPAEIRVTAHQDGKFITITISNPSPTISPQQCHQAFEQFYRLGKSRSSSRDGTGLGLTIARKICQLHGGNLSMTHKNGFTHLKIVLAQQGSNLYS